MHLLHVVGARPNFMKIAPVMRAVRQAGNGFAQTLVHTGQHYDDALSDAFLRDLDMPGPDFRLTVGSGSHACQTAEVMKRFEPVLYSTRPDLVIVAGDVNSTLACALVAAKMQIPVAHVEAGLRSGDRGMPEEINRVLTDALADLLLVPTREAAVNLAREGIPRDRIRFVGNVMIDSLEHQLARARARVSPGDFAVEPGRFAFATLHRPSNVDDPDPLAEIYRAFAAAARRRPLLFAMHPRTRISTERFALWGELRGVTVLPPLAYEQTLVLMDAAEVVLTDSGGIQEETTALGTPCVTLRDTTERPITVSEGTNVLAPSRTRDEIVACIETAKRKTARRPEGWDGHAASRIVAALEQWWAAGARLATAS
jgi:UDP-N-acetylglucosamine 2-epimerase (non-hydrolysing)